MAYVPDPTNPLQPTINQLSINMAYELQAIKGYIQSLVAVGSNFSYIGSFRNRLKNGSFLLAQRGVNLSVASNTTAYTVDQWIVHSAGSATAIAREGPGNTIPGIYDIALTPGASNTSIQLSNRIESLDCLDLLSGTPVTISGIFESSIIPASFTLQLFAPTAVDNWAGQTAISPVIPIVIAGEAISTWQFFSVTTTLTGDAINGLELTFTSNGYSSGTDGCRFANVQLEKGSVFTSFEHRPYSVELDLCQRYYQTMAYNSTGYTIGSDFFATEQTLLTTMRVVPTLVNTNTTSSNVTTPALTATAKQVAVTGQVTASGNYIYSGSFTASAEL